MKPKRVTPMQTDNSIPDLRNFPFFPIDAVRLRESELAIKAEPEIFRICVISWLVAWHRVPAGTLPNDDVSLAQLLGFGREVHRWRRWRAKGALRGWEAGADGLLRHPVVSEKVGAAWEGKLRQRARTEAARASKNATTPIKPENTTPVTDIVTTPVTERGKHDVTTISPVCNSVQVDSREGRVESREEDKREELAFPEGTGNALSCPTEHDVARFADFQKEWNRLLTEQKSGKGSRVTECVKETSNRLKHWKARMSDPVFREKWKDILVKAFRSEFLNGRSAGGTGWCMKVDWFLENNSNYTKVLEGNYDGDRTGASDKGGHGRVTAYEGKQYGGKLI